MSDEEIHEDIDNLQRVVFAKGATESESDANQVDRCSSGAPGADTTTLSGRMKVNNSIMTTCLNVESGYGARLRTTYLLKLVNQDGTTMTHGKSIIGRKGSSSQAEWHMEDERKCCHQVEDELEKGHLRQDQQNQDLEAEL